MGDRPLARVEVPDPVLRPPLPCADVRPPRQRPVGPPARGARIRSPDIRGGRAGGAGRDRHRTCRRRVVVRRRRRSDPCRRARRPGGGSRPDRARLPADARSRRDRVPRFLRGRADLDGGLGEVEPGVHAPANGRASSSSSSPRRSPSRTRRSRSRTPSAGGSTPTARRSSAASTRIGGRSTVSRCWSWAPASAARHCFSTGPTTRSSAARAARRWPTRSRPRS